MSALEKLGLVVMLVYFLSVMPAQMPADFKLVALVFFAVAYIVFLPLNRWKYRRTIAFLKGEGPSFRQSLLELIVFLLIFACVFLSVSAR